MSSVWGTNSRTNKLYKERVAGQAAEMGCARQLVDILAPHVTRGMSVLDVGCGAGYFFHSLRRLGLDYFGVDPTETYVEIGRRHLTSFGLDPKRLRMTGIEGIDGVYDVVICFNVIQHLPTDLCMYLGKLSDCARRFMVIRSSFHDGEEVVQEYGIDLETPDVRFLNVTYPKGLVAKELDRLGFTPTFLVDGHSGGKPERLYSNDVLIHPGIFFALRKEERP
jgi:SAM-dependent methyltransferase